MYKRQSLGTVTDVNGRFELSGFPPSATRLLISYISLMAKEVAIAPQVSVTLKSDTHLLDAVSYTHLPQMPNSTPRVRFLFIKSIVSTQFYVDAVSYTHLDVYKRQGSDRCICIDISTKPDGISDSGETR